MCVCASACVCVYLCVQVNVSKTEGLEATVAELRACVSSFLEASTAPEAVTAALLALKPLCVPPFHIEALGMCVCVYIFLKTERARLWAWWVCACGHAVALG